MYQALRWVGRRSRSLKTCRLLLRRRFCCCSVSKSCPSLSDSWTAARQAPLSSTNSRSLLKFMSIESVMPYNRHILCCPLLVPSIFPNIRVFSDEWALHIRWPKYWSFSFSISPSNEYSGLISFRIDWFDLWEAYRGINKAEKGQIWQKQELLQSSVVSAINTDMNKTHGFTEEGTLCLKN